MLFDFFKKKRRNNHLFADQLTKVLNQQPNNLHVMIYIKDQILFQLMPAKNFLNKGLESSNPMDLVAIHFFNKNKTLTFDKLDKFKGPKLKKEYFFFEDPIGNYNYLKILGQDPQVIEKELYRNFKEIYELDNLEDISIEYVDY